MKPADKEKAKDDQPGDSGDLDALLQQIYSRRGYDFREYKRASLQRRIQKRLYENHLSTYQEYMKLLGREPDEYAKLFDTLLINVSEFFRDPEAWEFIDDTVLPDILSRKLKGDSIRIWSAGCSTGEEAYSVAILIAEKLGDRIDDYNVRIYATDIDDGALVEARKGIYAENKVKNVPKGYLEKYFKDVDHACQIRRNVRQMIAFGRQDLISDAPISHLDLIICRNVLIYFNTELQSRVVTKFNYALNSDGYVFFGKSESMLAGSLMFTPVNKKWRIFRKTGTAGPAMPAIKYKAETAIEEGRIEQAVCAARKSMGDKP